MLCMMNGKQITVEAGTTLAAYLEETGLPAAGLVVERNGDILSATEWSTTVLSQADRIEIISFVAGG